MYEVVIAGVRVKVEQLMVDAAEMLVKGCIDYLEFLNLVADVSDECAVGGTL